VFELTGPISAPLRVPSVGSEPTGKPDWEPGSYVQQTRSAHRSHGSVETLASFAGRSLLRGFCSVDICGSSLGEAAFSVRLGCGGPLCGGGF
jgi:hypothetical protein